MPCQMMEWHEYDRIWKNHPIMVPTKSTILQINNLIGKTTQLSTRTISFEEAKFGHLASPNKNWEEMEKILQENQSDQASSSSSTSVSLAYDNKDDCYGIFSPIPWLIRKRDIVKRLQNIRHQTFKI